MIDSAFAQAKLHKAMLEGEGLVAALGEDDVDVKLPATVAGGAGPGQPHQHGKAEKPAATRTSAVRVCVLVFCASSDM